MVHAETKRVRASDARSVGRSPMCYWNAHVKKHFVLHVGIRKVIRVQLIMSKKQNRSS